MFRAFCLALVRRVLYARPRRKSGIGFPVSRIPPRLQPTALCDPWLGSALFRVPLGRILICECRSFVRRIGWLLDTELYRRGVWFRFVGHLGLHPTEAITAEDAYIRDTDNLFAQFQWATRVDERIFVEGWTRGALFALRNVCKLEPVISVFPRQPSISLPEPSEVLPDSKRGQSAPLPLRARELSGKRHSSDSIKLIRPSGQTQTKAARRSGLDGSEPKSKPQGPKSSSKRLSSPGRRRPKRSVVAPTITARELRCKAGDSTTTRKGVSSSFHFLNTSSASSGSIKAYRPKFVPAPKLPHFVAVAFRRLKRQLKRLEVLSDSKHDPSNPPPLRE